MALIAVLTANRARTMRDLEASDNVVGISPSTGRAKLKNGDEQVVVSTKNQLMGLKIDSYWVSHDDVPREMIDLAETRLIQGTPDEAVEEPQS